jgi:hypothetical protein
MSRQSRRLLLIYQSGIFVTPLSPNRLISSRRVRRNLRAHVHPSNPTSQNLLQADILCRTTSQHLVSHISEPQKRTFQRIHYYHRLALAPLQFPNASKATDDESHHDAMAKSSGSPLALQAHP